MAIDLRRATPTRARVLEWSLLGLFAVFFVIAMLVGFRAPVLMHLDQHVADRAFDHTRDHGGLATFCRRLGDAFGVWTFVGVVVVLVLWAWWRREWRFAVWVLAVGITKAVLSPLAKWAFHRDRPHWSDPIATIGGYSFPSGHAFGAGVLGTVAVLVTIVLTGRGWLRRVLIVAWSALAIVVAASRVFLGVHYLSDVVAGLVLGVLVTLGLWLLVLGRAAVEPAELAALTGTGRRRAAVVLNPAKVGDVEVFKHRVRLAAARHGWTEPLWYETSIEDPGAGQALAALRAGADLIVAAGGDGTVRAVCEEAARTGVAVAILPHGTGNLLARNLAIPLNVKDALDTAFSGQDRAIDLATFGVDDEEQTTFLVMAGLGMDAAIMNGVDPHLKEKVGWLAYFVSGVKAARFPVMRVQISVDDGELRKYRARTVVIGNVGFLQGGIPLLPDAQIDDGTLDVVVLAPKRLLGWLAIGVRLFGRQKRTNEKLDRLTGHKVVVKAEKPTPMQLDGDPVGEGTTITAQVHQGVLLVRVPLAPQSAS